MKAQSVHHQIKKQQVLVLEGLEKSAGKITFGAYYLYYKNRAVSVGSEFTNQDLRMYLFSLFSEVRKWDKAYYIFPAILDK